MVTLTSRLAANLYNSSTVWEKNSQDVSNANENYLNARDIGMARLNFNRLNLVSEISENDTVDYYKFNAISRGNLRVSVREADKSETTDEKAVVTDNNNEEKTLEEQKAELQDLVDSLKTKNVRVQLVTVNRGRETVVADSAGEKDSEELNNFEAVSLGEYRVKKQEMYYLKVSRIDTEKTSESYPYAVQIQIGDSHKYDYVTIEKKNSETTQNSKSSGNTKSRSSLNTKAQMALNNAVQLSSGKLKTSQLALNIIKNSSYGSNSSSKQSKFSFWG